MGAPGQSGSPGDKGGQVKQTANISVAIFSKI